ncbi:MAG: ParB/RepB/Spo0J family partition protein [Patescibacteria group bacterium]|nr:ParB/RepB/Spo0J family partition protein [Patescibacteria group bacterium]
MEVTDGTLNGIQRPDEKIGEILLVSCRKVRPMPNQPRKYFNPKSLRELADSIEEVGQTTPSPVRRLDPPEDGFEFELTDGERRYRACIMLNRSLKIQVDPDCSPKTQFKKSVAANFGRDEHTPMERAYAIKRLRELGETLEAVARIMGCSTGTIVQYCNLLKLDPEVQRLLEPENTPEEKLIKLSVALMLTDINMPLQLELAKQISESALGMSQAANLIRNTLRERGMTHRTMMPNKEFSRIATTVKNSLSSLTDFNQLSEVQLGHILKSRGLQERMAFVEKIESFERILREFKGKINRSMSGT